MKHAAAGLRDDTLGHLARPVGHIRPLPRGQPADRGAVAALRAGQDDDVAGQGAGRGQEDRRPRVPAGGGRPVSGR